MQVYYNRDGRATSDLRINVHLIGILFDIGQTHASAEAETAHGVGRCGIALAHCKLNIGDSLAVIDKTYGYLIAFKLNLRNAAARVNGIAYSALINGLKRANITINRKMLADLAVNDAPAFSQLVEKARAAL